MPATASAYLRVPFSMGPLTPRIHTASSFVKEKDKENMYHCFTAVVAATEAAATIWPSMRR